LYVPEVKLLKQERRGRGNLNEKEEKEGAPSWTFLRRAREERKESHAPELQAGSSLSKGGVKQKGITRRGESGTEPGAREEGLTGEVQGRERYHH